MKRKGTFKQKITKKRLIDDQKSGPCMLCKYGPPREFKSNNPTWADILKVVLFSLGDLYPKKQYFSLRYDIYQFIEDHWDFLECGKDKNSSWRQTVKMTLSRYSKLFENGYPSLQKRGFWKLREGIKPPPFPQNLTNMRDIKCSFNKTVETITYPSPEGISVPILEIPIPKHVDSISFEKLGKLFFTAHQFESEQKVERDQNEIYKMLLNRFTPFPSSPFKDDSESSNTSNDYELDYQPSHEHPTKKISISFLVH